MARRIDHVRTGQDAVTHFLKEYGERLNKGVVRDGDSLGWIVDVLEWISYGEHLAGQLIDPRYDPLAIPAEHPLIDVILDQFVRLGEPDEVYGGSFGAMEYTFREGAEITGADSLASLRNIGVGPKMRGEELADEAAAEGVGRPLDYLEDWGMPYLHLPKPLTLTSKEETVALAPLLVAGNSHDETVWPEYGYWVYCRIPRRSPLAKALQSAEVGDDPEANKPAAPEPHTQANFFMRHTFDLNGEVDIENGPNAYPWESESAVHAYPSETAIFGSSRSIGLGNTHGITPGIEVLVLGAPVIPGHLMSAILDKWSARFGADREASAESTETLQASLIALAIHERLVEDGEAGEPPFLPWKKGTRYPWLNLGRAVDKVVSALEGDFAIAVATTDYMHGGGDGVNPTVAYDSVVAWYAQGEGVDIYFKQVHNLGWGTGPQLFFGGSDEGYGIGISDDPTLLIESVDAPTPAVLVEKNKLNIFGFRTDCSDYLAVHKIYDVGTPLFGDEEWGQCVKFEEAVVASGKHINPYRKWLTGKEMAMSSGLFSIELSDDNKKQFSEGLAAYEEGFEAAKQTLNSDKNSSDLEDALDEISRDARSEIRNFRRTLPPTAPEKWTAKIAVELMRQEGEWLPGFIPAELVNEFSDKVMKPKQPKSPHIFEDHNGEKKWFSGFVNTIDRRVLQKAVDAGLRATINEEDFEKVATRFSDNVRNPDSAWGSYRDAQADLFNAVRDLYLKSTSRDADG